jgi:hypothetical protein
MRANKKRTQHTTRVDKASLNGLPLEGSPEFKAKRRKALEQLCKKYAWVAQQNGYVLRANPLKMSAYPQWVFDRISSAEFGFPYRTEKGSARRWKPKSDIDETFIRYHEPEYIEGDFRDDPFIIAERLEFAPGEPELTYDSDGCRALNLWHSPPWKVRSELKDPAPLLDHIRYLLDENNEAIEHVLDFIAHLVQRPQERIAHALLLTSDAKGIGKSSLGKVICALVGERNSRVAQTKDLKGQFDGWIVGKLVVQVDEVYEAGNWDLANKLKPLITEPRVSVNVKYGPQMEIENFARLVLFSNHGAPINIEEGDRRYFVFKSNAQPRDDAYYEQLYEFIDGRDGMDAVYTFFCKRDLSRFNAFRRPPLTVGKKEIIEDSVHPLRTYVFASVQSGHFAKALTTQFTFDELQRQLSKDGYGPQARNNRELGEALKAAGVTQSRPTIKGKKVRMYSLPASASAIPYDAVL